MVEGEVIRHGSKEQLIRVYGKNMLELKVLNLPAIMLRSGVVRAFCNEPITAPCYFSIFPENIRKLDVFRGYRKATPGCNGLKYY